MGEEEAWRGGGFRGGGWIAKEETNIMNELDNCRIIRHPCTGGNGVVIRKKSPPGLVVR